LRTTGLTMLKPSSCLLIYLFLYICKTLLDATKEAGLEVNEGHDHVL